MSVLAKSLPTIGKRVSALSPLRRKSIKNVQSRSMTSLSIGKKGMRPHGLRRIDRDKLHRSSFQYPANGGNRIGKHAGRHHDRFHWVTSEITRRETTFEFSQELCSCLLLGKNAMSADVITIT